MTYFDARELPEPTKEYVSWVDVMGIQSHMARSISVSANFVFKLHVAALDALRDGVSIYPIMDGFYATSATKSGIEEFLSEVFSSLAKVFSEEGKPHFQFIVRGAIAFGHVYHGRNIGDKASKRLAENPNYRAAVLLGEPVVHAYQSERGAPPFGIAIHHSARDSAPPGETTFQEEWWKWFAGEFDVGSIRASLETHYAWCRKRSATYDPARIAIHEALATKYFS